jgi:S-adenosylmethionine:tRNA ribosyltransferase-isomerase
MTGFGTRDFDYDLPPEYIAYRPSRKREESRLLVLDRRSKKVAHRVFRDVPDYLGAGDLLVVNDTRVIKARLDARKRGTGGRVELLLLREAGSGLWRALVSPSRRVHEGTELELEGGETCRVEKRLSGSMRLVRLNVPDVLAYLRDKGYVPLPPYIKRPPEAEDEERYQTVYAEREGSVAAPTAGLHFTTEMLDRLVAQGVEFARLTLHVGMGTFIPVKTELPEEHALEPEYFDVGEKTAQAINAARQEGRRIVAVGTTSVRVLETLADRFAKAGEGAGEPAAGETDAGETAGRETGAGETAVREMDGGKAGLQITGTTGKGAGRAGTCEVKPASGWTAKFIYPPYTFRLVDALVTNFHLPRSTLLMLVCAFAGREFVLDAYEEAIKEKYRFYSYGDAMLIL